jgi:hypothetical protein
MHTGTTARQRALSFVHHSHQQRLTSGMAKVCYSQHLGLVIATRHNTQNYLAELFFSLARQGIGATVRDFLNPEFCNT